MKKYKYSIKYKNGKNKYFYCISFTEAIVKAMSFAYEQAWNQNIETITDEKGKTINNIDVTYNLIF